MTLRRPLRRRVLRPILVLGVVVGLYSFASPALAATCGPSTVTVTALQSPDGTTRPFYGDWSHGSTKHSGYVGYQLSGATGVLGNDVWLKLSSFSSGIALATNQSASIPSRSVSSTGKPVVYAYLTAAAATATAQSWTIEVWNGKPGQAGSTQVCTTTDGFSSIQDIISANANKITSITLSNASPPLGGTFTVNAVGDTGTMGAGITADQVSGNGVFSMAPSMDDSWPADAFQLTGVQVTIGGATTRDKLRIYPSTSAAGAYTAVYSFSVRKAPGTSTAVYPVQSIASGSQVKYTGSYPTGITSIGVPTISSSMVKTAQSLVGPPYAVSYQVVASNTSTSPVTLDYLKDTPTASAWSIATGSATLNGQAIADPVNASGTLVFGGPFTIPAASGGTAGTLVFTYALNVTGTVSNSAIGEVGGVVIGGTNGGNNVTVDPTKPNITGSLADGTVNAAYSQALEAVGGSSPYAWAIAGGTLPTGLTLDPVTGAITGTPSEIGSFTFTVSVLDHAGASATRSYTVAIAAAPPSDTTAPVGAVVFDGSPSTITSPLATLDLSATDAVGVTGYRFAEGSDCSSASWVSVSPTTSFSTSVGIVLSASDGTKTVCAQFTDDAGNVSTTALTSVLLDSPPTLTLSSPAADPTNGAFTVTATFGKPVTGFALGDIVVGNGSASNLSGSGTTYTFTVTPTADGSVTVDVGDGAATDAAGTGNSAATRLARTYDGTAPTVALASLAPSPTNSSPFSVTATFSEPVTGFALGDLQLANATASNLSGSGTTYTFDVTPTADGTVSAQVTAGAAVDAAGNGSTASNTLSLTYDATHPAVVLSSASSSTLNGAFGVTATFSESVTGVDLGDISVGNGTASNLSGSGITYTFTVTPTAEGAVSVSLLDAAATDGAGNASTVSNTLSRTYDTTAPTVTLSSGVSSTTNASPIGVTATFSEPVTGFALGDLQLSNGTASNLAGSGTTYTFDVTPTTQGAVTVQVVAAAASDDAGNASLVSNQLARTYDSVGPDVTLTSGAPPTNAPFSVTATFTESVTGLTLGGLSVGNGTASNLSGSGTTYTFDVTPTGQGTVTVQVSAGAAADAAGNGSSASNTLTRTYDSVAPTVTLGSAATSPVSGAFSVTATFSEPVTGLTLGGLDVGNGTASNLAGSGTTYTFDVTPTADGTVTVQVTAGAAADAAGNDSTASTPLTLTFDGTPPTVTLSSSAPATTNTSPIAVTATFSEPVTGLALGDIDVTNGTASNLAGSGTSYVFDVTPAAQGDVTVQVAAAAAVDAAANASLVSNRLVREYDTVAPTVGLTTGEPNPTHATSFEVTATFSSAVTGLTLSDIQVTNGTASNLAGSGDTYTFDIAPDHDGTVSIRLPAGAAIDGATNPSTASSPLTLTFASNLPTVSIDDAPDRRTVDLSALFKFASDQAVTYTCSLDGAPFSPCDSTLTLDGLSPGDHTLTVKATNAYGASATATATWTVLVPPALDFDLTPPDGSQPDVAFTWHADPTALVECSLDDAAFAPCAAPTILTDLSDGPHTFTIRARTADGAQTIRTYTWTVARHATKPPAQVTIIPKIAPTDMLGRPQPFKQTQDSATSSGPFTRKLNVNLHIPTPPDVGSDIVYVSNYPDFRDSKVFPIAPDERYDWMLLAGPSGDRPVYIRFSDDADAAVGTADIILDQELPALSPKFVKIGFAPPAGHGLADVSYCGHAARRWITIGGKDGFSGLNAVQVASNPRNPCAWRPFLPAFSYRLPGRVVYIRVEDNVGNVSGWYRFRTPR